MAFDEELGGPRLPAFHLYLEVNMRRRPARIGGRFDRAKIIFSGGTGQETAEALEVRIELRPVPLVGEIDAGVVGLPELDGRVSIGSAPPNRAGGR